MNFARNHKYFTSPSAVSGKTVVIGAIIGIIFLYVKFIFGLLVLVALGVYIYFKVKGKIKDSDIDLEYQKGMTDVVKKGLDKLGIDEEEVKLIDPIVIHGPYYKNIVSGYYTRKGEDNRWRSSNYEVTVLYFSEKQVYSYNYRFSIVNSEKNESTDEYFYKDIVSVSTSSDTITTNNNETFNLEYFKLTTSGGTSISCAIWDMGEVEKSIRGMKQLLREKKSE